jgi:RNA polymerase sigma factor (sigma-70 family)
MGTAPVNGFLQRLRQAMAAETLSAFPDSELIDRFLANHEEAAFQALLHRHGPMVLRVCRRTLSDEHDVEDAFQASFLALASQARTLRKRESLASWLHCIAYHIALDACKSRKRRRKHEAVAAVPDRTPALADDVAWKELRSILDEELASLPERLSAPLVLCYLEGLTQDEAAARLGQSKSSFRRNLERARKLLGNRLTRRGITLSAALFAPLLSDCAASAAVPAVLAAATTEAAVAYAAGKAVAALATARALALAKGLVQPLVSAKIKCVCALLLAAVVAGGAVLSRDAHSAPPMLPPAERQPEKKATRIDSPAVANSVKPKAAEHIEFQMPFLAAHAAVQRELNLNAEQVQKIRGVLREVEERATEESNAAKPSIAVPLRPGAVADPAYKLFQAKQEALRKALPEILTVKQARRLRQIERQHARYGAFLEPENQRLLGLTVEQRGKVEAIVAALLAKAPKSQPPAHDNRAVREPNDRLDAEVEEYRKAEKAAADQILQLLTPNQAKIWRDLVGESIELPSLHRSEL